MLIKGRAQKRWKYAMKGFHSEFPDEDILYTQNSTGEYRFAKNNEFLQQLNDWSIEGRNHILNEENTRMFTWKGNWYVLITINAAKDNDQFWGGSGAMINEQAFALNFVIAGFSYLFKKDSFDKIKNDIKKKINYIELNK